MTALEEARNDSRLLGITIDCTDNAWSKININGRCPENDVIQTADKDIPVNEALLNENEAEIQDEYLHVQNYAEDENERSSGIAAQIYTRANEITELAIEDENQEESTADLVADHDSLLNLNDDTLNLKYFDTKDDVENGPFVKIVVGKEVKSIRNTTLCWFLDQKQHRISTDRLTRFKTTPFGASNTRPRTRLSTSHPNAAPSAKVPKKNRNPNRNHAFENTSLQASLDSMEIIVEEYYAVFYPDKWYLGRILHSTEDGIATNDEALVEYFLWYDSDAGGRSYDNLRPGPPKYSQFV
ncbi:uncharacterized protein LOC116176733 [Photinus pyralis]|uniref:uncharacterized protein LOC116176733 n=1 Tax=Photinus pyralis TaxID=7054 RepID=UPI001267829A|nr:uncharacterized protein LOC116176733 [Photinus pyralis]